MPENGSNSRPMLLVVAVNMVLMVAAVFLYVWLGFWPILVMLLPTLFVVNYRLIRNRARRSVVKEGVKSGRGNGSTPCYLTSVLFFLGTLYGLSQFVRGEACWLLSPLLVIPLAVAVLLFKTARKLSGQAT